MNWFLDQVFGQKVKHATDAYLRDLANLPIQMSREKASQLLRELASVPGRKIMLGETMWGEPVAVPLEEIVRACALVGGGMGAGKSRLALGILENIIDAIIEDIVREITARRPSARSIGIGLLDPKGETYDGAIEIVRQRLDQLRPKMPEAAKRLRRLIHRWPFASRDPVCSYNILVRPPGVDPEFFASTRAELMLDLLPASDGLSLSGKTVLKKIILLLSEFGLPITRLVDVINEATFRAALLQRSKNLPLKTYFARQFAGVPKATLDAINRRVEALFESESVRLALTGPAAPDFRRLQDESKIVFLNCFGANISRGVRRLLQALIISDIRQALFTRETPDNPFLWICDEAQNFFLTEALRDTMADLLTMSRSFGSYFLLLTQNMTTAVQDQRLLRIFHTIMRWSLALRGEPHDAAFMKAALAVTGRRERPRTSPFEESRFYPLVEERNMALEEIASLPDRVGYLWLKARSPEAIKIRTRNVDLPTGRALVEATRSIARDATVGGLFARKEYERLIAERDRKWEVEEEEGDVAAELERAYRRTTRREGT